MTKLDELLESIRQLLDDDKELARHLDYKIQPKNNGDRQRLAKFAKYSGPDNDTLELLKNYARNWYDNPTLFWDCSSMMEFDVVTDPQAQIFRAFLQSKHDSA